MMKSIFRNQLNRRNLWQAKFMVLLAVTLLGCSKEDNTKIETLRSTASKHELILGKWFVDLAHREMASHCLSQYYLDFNTGEVKNTGSLAMIDDQPELLVTTVALTKICELPDETTHAYTWADDESLTVMIDPRPMDLSIISVSSTHLILHNKATDKMMVLKRGS